MRKILFRGKRVDNKTLVYGDYYYSLDDNAHIITEIIHCDNFICDHMSEPAHNEQIEYYINIDTLSQFTGVTDKNETKVFENDKVIVHENVCGEIKDWTANVAFKGGSFCLVNEDDYPICSLCEVCGTFEVIPG